MSYQGAEWAWKVRGLSRGERCVLDYVAYKQDQRSNVAKASVCEIAECCEMSERQVTRILDQLSSGRPGYRKGILQRIHGGNGRGIVSLYSLVGFEKASRKKADAAPAKVDILSGERVTNSTEKGDIFAPAIRKEGKSLRNTLIQERQNITPSGAMSDSPNDQALKFWLKFKDEMLRARPSWEFWLLPMYFMRLAGARCLLLSLPPVTEIVEEYRANRCAFNDLLLGRGYEHNAVRYPSAAEIGVLACNSPEWSALHERLLRGENRAQRKPVQAATA